VIIEPYFDEHRDAQSEQFRVYDGVVGFNESGGLQLSDALQGWGRREANIVGKLCVSDSTTFLKDFQDVEVNFVKFHSKGAMIMLKGE
jgi:hypothetical protein